MKMKVKYKILAVINGITKEYNFRLEEKDEAISTFKDIKKRADRCVMFSIDSEDPDIWYNIGKNY